MPRLVHRFSKPTRDCLQRWPIQLSRLHMLNARMRDHQTVISVSELVWHHLQFLITIGTINRNFWLELINCALVIGFMAEGPPARPRFFLDEERNNSFIMKKLHTSRYSVPASDAERQSAAAIRAIVDDDDDDDDDGVLENSFSSSSSTSTRPEEPLDAVEAKPSAAKPTTLWTRLQTGWEEVEDRLAEWFGLDQSKYQWAVDELLERQLAGDQPAASKANVDGLQMQNIQEQSMKRDLGGSHI